MTDLKGSLTPVKPTHRAAITDPQAIGGLLRASDDYQGHFVTRCALRLAPLFFARPGELRMMDLAELDLEQAVWILPAAKIKMSDLHMVPLTTTAIAIQKKLEPLTGLRSYVLTS